MQERVVVSTSAYIDPNKVGVRTTNSSNAKQDLAESVRLEQSDTHVAYVKKYYDESKDFRPRGPSAPPLNPELPQQTHSQPPKHDPPQQTYSQPSPKQIPPQIPKQTPTQNPPKQTSTPQTHIQPPPSSAPSHSQRYKSSPPPKQFQAYAHYDNHSDYSTLKRILAAVAGFSLLFWLGVFHTQTAYGVSHGSWAFKAQVNQLRDVRREGWELPNGATVFRSEQRVRRTTRVEQLCSPYDEEYQELVGHDMKPEQVFDGYEEIYSHTEEVCFSDGECEKKDVYKKGGPKYKEEYTKIPIYQNKMRTVTKCEDIAVQDSSLQAYYLYDVKEWVHVSDAAFDSSKNSKDDLMKSLLPGHKYTHESWDYRLHLKNGSVQKVKSEDFEKFERDARGMAIVHTYFVFYSVTEYCGDCREL